MLTDTHCHLNFDRFDADRGAVVGRASETGLVRILNPAIDLQTAQAAVALAAQYEMVYAAVGLHPNSAMEWDEGLPGTFRRLAEDPKVVAIGEIGLDYYWDEAPHDLQQEVLRRQLELAAQVELPVIIHNRESTADVLAILLEWQAALRSAGNPLADRPGVLHSFSGDRDAAERAITANYFIGITGPVTFKNAPDLQALVKDLPLDHLLIETDSPFLTPHPHRGKRNEPAYVALVAEKIAALKGLEVEEVVRVTGENAHRLFGW